MIGIRTSNDKVEKIKTLRISGFSLNAICRETALSKSVVSHYIKGIRKDNGNPQSKVGANIVRDKWEQKKREVEEHARNEWPAKRKELDFMCFLSLYWGEGGKTNGYINVTNSDPYLIKVCYDGFVALDQRARIIAEIRYYPSHDIIVCERYWQALLPNAIIRLRPVNDKRIKYSVSNKCKYGICRLQFSNWKIYHSILTWINCWKSELAP